MRLGADLEAIGALKVVSNANMCYSPFRLIAAAFSALAENAPMLKHRPFCFSNQQYSTSFLIVMSS